MLLRELNLYTVVFIPKYRMDTLKTIHFKQKYNIKILNIHLHAHLLKIKLSKDTESTHHNISLYKKKRWDIIQLD